MRRNRWALFLRVSAAACLLLPGLSNAQTAPPAPEPSPPASPTLPPADPSAVNVFLNTPADLGALWKSLARPDFVILRSEEYTRLVKAGTPAASGSGSSAASWDAVVSAVTVRGTVRNDFAQLGVDCRIHLANDSRTWVPIQLDGLTLTAVREGARALRVRSTEGAAWEVELEGRGDHAVTVELVLPVRLGSEGKRVELAIPRAASTRFELDVPQRVRDARAGPAEPIAFAERKETGLTRLAAELSPRPRLTVDWQVEEEAGAPLPPLLVLREEIAVDIEPGSFRTRASCSIRSVRGTARSLQFRLDPEDEVLEVELDGQTPPAGIERADGALRMTIPLAEPLGPGQERRLVMTTRRSTPTRTSARVEFGGFPLINAGEQSGAVGVAQGANLFVSGTAGRGARRIDPRTELPADLRARPATVLAYQFSEQPFELSLQVDPSPPLVRSEARTNVLLQPGSATVDTWFDYQTTRGKLEDLTLTVPPGLEIESVGPDDLVRSWQSTAQAATASKGSGAPSPRLLTVRVEPKGPDGSRFALHVVAKQPIGATGDVAVSLAHPAGAVSAGGRLAVVTDPSLTVDLAEQTTQATPAAPFRQAPASPTADWVMPSSRGPGAVPALWLEYSGTPTSLPLRLTSHPLSVTHQTTLQIHLDRREAIVHQESALTIRYGTLDQIDILAPTALEGRWELEGAGVAAKNPLGAATAEGRAYRLRLQADLARSGRLKFRYRVPLANALSPRTPADVSIPWIQLRSGSSPSTPPVATVTADQGLTLRSTGSGWRSADESPGGPAGPTDRLELTAEDPAGPVGLEVTARALAELPRRVVPRLALLTTQTPEGLLRTNAWFAVETRERSIALALPPGAELEQALVGGEVLAQVDQLPQPGAYRLNLPARPTAAPITVELSYASRPGRPATPWIPPTLLEDAVVQQCLWEVRLPWSQALVGVPSGWSDENEWYWDNYVWKRRPWRTTAALAAWGAGGATARVGRGPDDLRGEYHGYLFGRPGPPSELRVSTASRALLVAFCSGFVLGVGGILILAWRPWFRWLGIAALGLGLAIAALVHSSVTFLVLQSSAVGLILTLLLGAIHRVVERRRPRPALQTEPSVLAAPIAAGSTFNRVMGVGSDDSTAIRARPVPISTMDYRPAAPPTMPSPLGNGASEHPLGSERTGRGGASP